MSTIPFVTRAPEIPADKAATVARLDAMRQDGWAALESMNMAELDALAAEVESAVFRYGIDGMLSANHPHAVTIQDAREAIKHRRSAIRKDAYFRAAEQSDRHKSIVWAAKHIQDAVALIARANAVDPDPFHEANRLPDPLPPIDAANMSDDDLRRTIEDCQAALGRDPGVDYTLFAMLKTAAAKSITAELKARREAFDALFLSARVNLDAASRELERRKAEADERAARNAEIQANLTGIVADLQARIAELEASR